MEERLLRGMIERLILINIAKTGEYFVPVSSSNRHIHLSQEHIDRLFYPGYQLTKLRDLMQPGQFACNERVILRTSKGSLVLRVVGPARNETQVEISMTEARQLGIPSVVKMSGDLEGSPGGAISNGDKSVELIRGVIIAARHLHMSPEEAESYKLKNGDSVSISVEGNRPTVFERVIVRVVEGHVLEAHLDIDEANSAGLKDGTLCRVIAPNHQNTATINPPESKAVEKVADYPHLITEEVVIDAFKRGERTIAHQEKTIITPLGRDAARKYNIDLLVKGMGGEKL